MWVVLFTATWISLPGPCICIFQRSESSDASINSESKYWAGFWTSKSRHGCCPKFDCQVAKTPLWEQSDPSALWEPSCWWMSPLPFDAIASRTISPVLLLLMLFGQGTCEVERWMEIWSQCLNVLLCDGEACWLQQRVRGSQCRIALPWIQSLLFY